MFYDARQVANWFIKRARQDGRVLPVTDILKLAYFAQARHLAEWDAPLFPNKIEAWELGPVVVDVFAAFENQGMKVSAPLPGLPDITNGIDAKLLERVWDEYGRRSASELSRLTHVRNGPWELTGRFGGWYAPIPVELIKDHHKAEAGHG